MFSRQIIFRNLLVIFIVFEKKTTIESDRGNDKDTISRYLLISYQVVCVYVFDFLSNFKGHTK